MTDLVACKLAGSHRGSRTGIGVHPAPPCDSTAAIPVLAFHGVEDMLLPYDGGGTSAAGRRSRTGARPSPNATVRAGATESQYRPTVEQLAYTGCDEPVVLYRVHGNGHTWPGHPLGLDRDAVDRLLLGQGHGSAVPVDGRSSRLTPEQFADSISLANQDIDASAMIWEFFSEHTLTERD